MPREMSQETFCTLLDLAERRGMALSCAFALSHARRGEYDILDLVTLEELVAREIARAKDPPASLCAASDELTSLRAALEKADPVQRIRDRVRELEGVDGMEQHRGGLREALAILEASET